MSVNTDSKSEANERLQKFTWETQQPEKKGHEMGMASKIDKQPPIQLPPLR